MSPVSSEVFWRRELADRGDEYFWMGDAHAWQLKPYKPKGRLIIHKSYLAAGT